ncbi:MAG: FecR domain-containing protein [Deltaproteobacteria bacterium]|nr:FecR domain-containing protein [Deltaproteobacteria bacterium]
MKIAHYPIAVALLFLLSAVLPSRPAIAADKTGRLITIRDGKLERFSGGAWHEVKKGGDISAGDRLRTDKTGLAVVELPGTGRLVIGPDTEMLWAEDTKEFKGKVARGSVWLNSKLPKGGRASISTSLATAGVRGTKFSVCSGEKAFCACTCSGEVEVLLNDGSKIPVQGGRYYWFNTDKPLPDVTKPAWVELENRNANFGFCFNCHEPGKKGELKRDLDLSIPLQ